MSEVKDQVADLDKRTILSSFLAHNTFRSILSTKKGETKKTKSLELITKL